MTKTASKAPAPDQRQRERALDPTGSILVQAPAGSGKTDLLTRRFLRLLGEVDDPGQIVAITFTIAAAAEMRHRILSELETAAARQDTVDIDESDEFSMDSLAWRAHMHSNARDWKLLDLPSQLRISTIDSFCRDLALQQPLLSGFGGGLAIAEQPDDLYRRAARHTIEQIDRAGSPLAEAVAKLLDWDDNNWQELESLLVSMLGKRDRWMHDFLLSQAPDWDALRERLERPFGNAVRDGLTTVGELLNQIPGARDEILALARFGCSQSGGQLHRELAELAEFPSSPFLTPGDLEEAHQALSCVANLVLIGEGTLRKQVDKRLGFPADRKPEKARILALISDLADLPDLESALAAVRNLPPARYTEDDWEIVRASFTLLRHAAAQLKVVFAEAAAVDFIEVAQIAESVLTSDDGDPSDAAIAVADGIHHLLVDEFQDTSRRQHQLLSGLIAAWPDRTGRTLFAVGDPMQSIYFFRDADAELFARVKEIGLEIPNAEPLTLDFVQLSANFRTIPNLVERLNDVFARVFAEDDGSGVTFSSAEPARESRTRPSQDFKLHLNFAPQSTSIKSSNSKNLQRGEDPRTEQVQAIVELIRGHQMGMEEARAAGRKYRIAVLARAKKSLVPIAQALRDANDRTVDDAGKKIHFRAVELEKLAARPEVLDALSLIRAVLNPQDRVAWLGMLRAPWCALTLDELHILTSADDPALLARPVPDLLAERLSLLSRAGQSSARRVLSAVAAVPSFRASLPTASPGTWMQQIWLSLGGADCCSPAALANVDLLWTCLDRLPDGEQDLPGPALDAALDKLTALPDPEASTDWGVQLMTIHKSKGLEFEVVIVPDLQAKTAGSSRKLLSWLERGLKPGADSAFETPESAGEITEFLVAPLPSKGEDSGKSKAWVDRVYRDREAQETRRILYVAATRAREELHLFARPCYKVEANGELSLLSPSVGLLSTAWPALADEVRARFGEWKATRQPEEDGEEEAEIESLAASAGSALFLVPPASPAPIEPTLLRRLPLDYEAKQSEASVPFPAEPGISGLGSPRLYTRHEGGLASRVLGTAVHSLLEELARLCTRFDWPTARSALQRHELRIAAQIRAAGIAPAQAAQIAANALEIALNSSQDPTAQWVLSPHPEAASEVRWSGVVSGMLTNVRVDRLFRAGLTPRSDGADAWWIVDYKTAHADKSDPLGDLPQLRTLFAAQLVTYGRILRNLHGADAVIRAGLYYPRMSLFDWWEI
ncbi:MAG: UvrD-helicase domain-containing protein [Terracidiphilus sp.]|jgi:ATP-dependent exoDNAse (exonuclease V) beta subunit